MPSLWRLFILTYHTHIRESQGGHLSAGHLEVGDDLGDVGVHLVKLGVLGGRLPVLATGHSVHDVLSEKGITISTGLCCLHTWMRAK